MRLSIGAVTHRGRIRSRNEDTVALGGYLSTTRSGVVARQDADTERPVLLAVADGLGGHQAGDRASQLSLRFIADTSDRLRSVNDVRSVLRSANDAVYEEMALNRSWRAMGTTVAGFVFVGAEAICFNVGDSRCYALIDGALAQLSTDDSPQLEGQEPGAVTHIVTQTLGGSISPVDIEPHVRAVPIAVATRFMACSDGLSDYVLAATVEHLLAESVSVESALAALLSAALDAGGHDNISIVMAEARSSSPATSGADR